MENFKENINLPRLTPSATVSYDFDQANYELLENALTNLSFNFNSQDIDTLYDEIHAVIFGLIDQLVPKKIRTNLTCPPHFDKSLRILRNKRNKAFKKMWSTGLPEHVAEFEELSTLFK